MYKILHESSPKIGGVKMCQKMTWQQLVIEKIKYIHMNASNGEIVPLRRSEYEYSEK